jgi:hypothetical protein
MCSNRTVMASLQLFAGQLEPKGVWVFLLAMLAGDGEENG